MATHTRLTSGAVQLRSNQTKPTTVSLSKKHTLGSIAPPEFQFPYRLQLSKRLEGLLAGSVSRKAGWPTWASQSQPNTRRMVSILWVNAGPGFAVINHSAYPS
jgi:hypothetical protein